MTETQARRLAEYHAFTKIELYEILKEALDTFHPPYWKKANPSNPIFDNGHYFNWLVKLVDYDPEASEYQAQSNVPEVIVVRVLERYGQFSKVQIPDTKKKVEIKYSEEPKL